MVSIFFDWSKQEQKGLTRYMFIFKTYFTTIYMFFEGLSPCGDKNFNWLIISDRVWNVPEGSKFFIFLRKNLSFEPKELEG